MSLRHAGRSRIARSLGFILVGVWGCTPPSPAMDAEPEGPNPEEPAPNEVVVPFEFTRNQIVMQVMLEGQGPFNMLLDTAVDPSAVDLATADQVGLPVDRDASGEASGTGSDRRTIYAAEITGLQIAGRRFEPLPAVAVDMAALEERLGVPLHGVLGYSFLSTRAVKIDYPARQVHIYDGAAPESTSPDRFEIPMTFEGHDVVIDPLHVNDLPLRVSLDTGSSLTLEVYGPAVERLGLGHLREDAEAGSVMGARGEATILTSPVGSIRVGNLESPDPEIIFPERDGRTDGNLGNGFLQSFVLTVDYVSKRVIIER